MGTVPSLQLHPDSGEDDLQKRQFLDKRGNAVAFVYHKHRNWNMRYI